MATYERALTLLGNSPFHGHKEAVQAYDELKQYLQEMKQEKQQELEAGTQSKEPNLLDLLVSAGTPTENRTPSITQDAILGNIFIFLFAGHEANVNTLLFTFILLAAHPLIQRLMQSDIDRLTPSWSYAAYNPLMNNSLVGAVLNETMRLYSVIPILAKTTLDAPQALKVDGDMHTIAPNTVAIINTSAVHRNPKAWRSRGTSPLASFDPEQWMETDADGNPRVRNPVDGSFLAFSDGNRGCLGKPFGQAELCAFVARLFREFTVELKVDGEGEEEWRRKRGEVERSMVENVEFYMSLRLAAEIPVRFVRRGRENFGGVEG